MLKKKATLHQFVPHFEALRPVILQRCLDTFREFRETPRADAYYVLCHGDFTIKNMMFKHNSADGSLVDVQLLDFQLSYVGSIASDLIYSMVQLLDEHLRKQFPILVEYYFNIFIETLLKLKYKGALPKLEKLREQLVWHKHFELFQITTFLPIWYMLREQNVDPVDLHTSAEYRRSMYRNQSYIAEMEQLLPKYLNL
ncbi:PREDICTED: uncharacterized protein LOC108378882, partial [Rhagoletis zephyria]|uniref:uncharacterized protein LOC108378882 n=1 Tax=Rhagoletis zephyria TaxID=28612 RepID=UPI00081152F7